MIDQETQELMRLRKRASELRQSIARAMEIEGDAAASKAAADFEREKSQVCSARADLRLQANSPHAAAEYFVRMYRYADAARFFDGYRPDDAEEMASVQFEREADIRHNADLTAPVTFYWSIHFVMCRSERRQFGGQLLEGYVDITDGTEEQHTARYQGMIISHSASDEDFPPIKQGGFYSQKDAMAWVERTMKNQESEAIK